MTLNLHLPSQLDALRPKITVIGVGGAGGNAVNNMIAANLEGVDFVMANTDAQALEASMTERVIQLGGSVTRGLGAGASPEIGGAAAEEALDDISDAIEGSNMVFITAGMGGGTGTGAAPVIARQSREQGILTVGVVTKPFHFEGSHRMKIADSGIEELQQYVDTLIVIPNQNLFRVANEKTTFADAFRMADEVLHSGVRGVTDLMVKPGLVNLDFADIRAVMSEMGKAMMGTGEAQGEKRAIDAAEAAISNPLLDDVSLNGARAVLINITGGPDMTLFEVDEAANRIRDEVDPDANIIFGSTFSDALEGTMRVSVVATGIEAGAVSEHPIRTRTMAQAMGRAAAPKPVATKPSATSNFQPTSFSERSPAEIVRQSGQVSAAEAARLKQQQETTRRAVSAEPTEFEPQGSLAIEPAERAAPMTLSQIRAAREEEEELNGGPLFVAPRAVQPAEQTLHTARAPEPEAYADEEDEEAGNLGFFQRLSGMAKGLAHREEEEDLYYEEEEEAPRSNAARAKVRETKPAASDDEEYLDIPAFLRRQAN